MLKTLKVDNFKALNGAEIVFTPFTVLIGNNSVGKSTVLQAISFLKYCCIFNFGKFLDERRLTVSDVCSKFGTKKTVVFSASLELDGHDIQWDISIIRGRDSFALTYEKVTSDGTTVLSYSSSSQSYRLNAKTGEKEIIMSGIFSSSIIQFTDMVKQADEYPALTSIKKFFTKMETLDLLSPYNMKGSSQGEASAIGLSGEKLASFIKTLPAEERILLTQDIQKFIPSFSSVQPKTKQYGWVHLEAKETYNGKNIDISSVNISDGILRIIAFCSLRFLNNRGGAILLDEIEDGINNEHLSLLVQVLQQIQREKHVQIIATTHNTVLLDYWIDKTKVDLDAAPDKRQNNSIVFVCRGRSGEVLAKNIFSSEEIRDQLSYLFPGEIILNMTNEQLQTALTEGE